LIYTDERGIISRSSEGGRNPGKDPYLCSKRKITLTHEESHLHQGGKRGEKTLKEGGGSFSPELSPLPKGIEGLSEGKGTFQRGGVLPT